MYKVMTIVGTRPEVIRLSRVIDKLDLHFDHVLVHTGQNYDYELNGIFFDQLSIRKPDHFLEAVGESAAITIGNVIAKADSLLARETPDAVLVLGDTNSSLASIAAKRRRVPIFHMEAGNRCFDFRVPEEVNRRIVDHISDVNLTYSQIAREYLLREGIPPESIICTGSPMREVLEFYGDQIKSSSVIARLNLEPGKYFVASIHREENVDNKQNLSMLIDAINSIADTYLIPIVFSVHPRTRKKLADLGGQLHDLIQLHEPFGFLDYISLQTQASVVLSDSGTITEESSILGFSALNLREVQERPEGFEEGAVMMTGLDPDSIRNGLRILLQSGDKENSRIRMVSDYSPNNVSEKIVRIIASYIGFVNRNVWKTYPAR